MHLAADNRAAALDWYMTHLDAKPHPSGDRVLISDVMIVFIEAAGVKAGPNPRRAGTLQVRVHRGSVGSTSAARRRASRVESTDYVSVTTGC
jgi:hypothetical protein